MKKQFGISVLLAIAALGLETSVYAGEGCTLELGSTLSTYFSRGLEHNLISHLQQKGYKVNSSAPAAYGLSANAVCVVNGQQAAERPCSDALRFEWTFVNLKTGKVLSHFQEDYSSLFFPLSRASNKVHSLMRTIPQCMD